MPYGSPSQGSPQHVAGSYGPTGQLPPPYSQMPWQISPPAPVPPPKPNHHHFRDPLPRGEQIENHNQLEQQSINAEQFIQMGFNSDSVRVAKQHYSGEQDILDFLFLYEDLTRQGHDSEAVERLCVLVGLSDKASINAILTNVPYLHEMGFPPTECVEALFSSKNDKESALDLLLNKS
jgi:hypothetical protein